MDDNNEDRAHERALALYRGNASIPSSGHPHDLCSPFSPRTYSSIRIVLFDPRLYSRDVRLMRWLRLS